MAPLLYWQWGTALIATAVMAVGARVAGRHCCDGSGGHAARGVSRRHGLSETLRKGYFNGDEFSLYNP